MRPRHDPSPVANPDWRIVLGISGPRLTGWDRVRVAQITELRRVSGMIAATHGIGALALVAMLWDTAPRWELLCWLAAIVGVMAEALHTSWRARHRNLAADPRPAMRRATMRAIFIGLLWMVPTAHFSGSGTIAQQLAICLVAAAMIAEAAIAVSAVPPAMLAFVSIASAGLMLMMAKTGSPLLTVLPVAFACCLGISGVLTGRAFMRRKWAEIALAEKHEVVSMLLRESEDQAADWLWQVDTARRLLNVAPAMARAADRTAEELEGTPLFRLLAGERWEEPAQAPELSDLLDRMNARERFVDFELPVPIGDETRWWRLSGTPREDERGTFTGYHGVGSDITDARRSAEKIDRMARYDALTGLSNRSHFHEALRKALSRAFRDRGRCALMLIDLDRFKAVNDTLGHPVGDKLLRLVAQRLLGLTGGGELCARLGGDEFAMVIGNANDVHRIDALGNAIIAALGAPFEIDGQIVRIGASVGIALGPRDGRSADMLIRNADLALYRAKADGRGVHRRFEPGLLVRAQERRAIEGALRDALDDGQLRLTYQPVVSALDGHIAGFEALLRWRHPELGEVPPDEFIPIAAEAQLLGQIGEWVIRTACEEAACWPDHCRVSVNLARDQIVDPELPAIVRAALDHSGLAPSRLALEVGERAFREDSDSVAAAIDRLRALSVRVSLDDFGVSASALGHIRRGRFSTVKIDRSLIVAAANRDPDALGLIRAIVALTSTLEMNTTAEGAETPAEQRIARDLGCTHLQGFLSGMPVPPEEARAMITGALRRIA